MKFSSRWLVLLTSHISLLTSFSIAPLLLCSPAVVNAQWEPDVRLTFNDSASLLSNNNAHCIAASGDTVHVVWYDNRTGNFRIYYKRSMDAGTTWGQDTCLSSGPDSSTNPSIAVSGPNVHLVWQDYRDGNWEIYYKRSLDGGASWEPEIRLTTDIIVSQTPSLTVLDSLVQVAWCTDTSLQTKRISYKSSRNRGASWQPDTILSRDATYYPALPCLFAYGSSVFLSFVNDFGSIYFKRSQDMGFTWSADTVIAKEWNGPRAGGWYLASSIVSWGSNVYMFCRYHESATGGAQFEAIDYRRSTNGGLSWLSLSHLVGPTVNVTCASPSACASGSNVHLVWWDNHLDRQIYYLTSTNEGTGWSPPVQLTNDSAVAPSNPFIAVSGSKLHVVWYSNREGNNEIYYKRNLTGNGIEENAILSSVSSPPFSVRPNPFVSFATIPDHEGERFTLYDISGRKVGIYRGDRIGEGLGAGVYFLKPEDKDAKPLRIVKVR